MFFDFKWPKQLKTEKNVIFIYFKRYFGSKIKVGGAYVFFPWRIKRFFISRFWILDFISFESSATAVITIRGTGLT